jgi:hypothetical protein
MTTLERRTEEKSFLKYGEHIILASFQQNLYLANRGLPFQAGVIAKSKREETINKFYLYPNLHEIVFEIHPNLNYEALMEFNECSNNDPNQDILEKRMVLEANLNHAKIEENRGKYVKLGSIVQLYHPNSKTYISFTTQKIGNSEMCAIGCSEETSESVQFTITSPFDFLKEGSLISYDDKFLFTDAYNKTLAYPISSDELESTKLRIEKKAERGILNFFGGSKEREFKIPSIIENQKLFQGHFAGAVNEKSIGFKYSNQFEAINIESSFEKNELKENDLRWGDVINIRRVDNSGKYSLMVAEVNKSSFGNNVLYRTFNQDYSSKMVNLESQFEIIHLKNKARGTSITFDKFNTVKVLLKHVLSGKFLTVDPNTQKLVLGKDYEDEFENLKRDRSKLENDYQIQYNAYMRLKEAKRFEDITKKDAPNLTQADIDFFQAHGKELIQTNKDYFKAYLIQRTFILEKVSSDESLNLNNSTFLKIRTCNNKCISISNDVEHLNLVTDDVRKKEENENFENNFFETLGRSIEQETVIASDVCDIFHFEKNEKNLVRRFNRLNSYTAFLASVLCMEEIKQSTTLQYISVVDSIESIIQKLISKKKLLKHAAQYLMVQMSTVDLLMEFLIKVKSISKESDDHLRLVTDACAVTISLLSLICENNSLVCTYMFQWRKFFTVSIVKVDNPVFKQVNIDSLLFQIVDILKCYSIYIDDYLSNLCSSIKFESLDVRKLTVLLQITKNFLHLQDPVSVDKVFEKIFNQAYKSDIFKKLEYEEMDNNRIHFLAKDERIELDEHFKENEQIYKYFLQILNLVISLGELDAAKTAKNLHEYFPKEVCIYIFTDREHRYTGEMRAAFLKLFALLYIVNLFQNNGLITYEEHITAERVRGDFRKSSETLKSLQSLKESDENRQFMGSLLSNLTSSNAELALASLQTFNLLLGFKFFDDEYVLSIKTNLDGLVVGDARRVRIEEAEHFRKEPVRDNKRLSVMPQRVESFTFEDKREDTQESPAFASDDPTTLIEVVEMLTKLHRSILRNKVLQAINQDKKSMQTEGSPRGSPSNKELTKEEAAFKRVFGSELTALNEKNEDVWKVITQWIKLKNPKLTSSILKYIFESSLMKGHFIEKYNEFFQVEDDEENSIYIRVRAYLRNFSDQLRDLMSEYSTSEFSTIRIRCSSLFKEYQALFDYFFIVMHPNDRQTKFELAIKEHNRLRVNDLIDLNAQDVFINIFNMFLMDCKNFKSKQTIIFKSGLLEIVMKTAICFNNKIFVSYPRLESEQVEKSRFRLLAEFAPEDPFKDELNTILYLILYFSLATNPENIGFLMGAYRADLQEFILAGLRSKNGVVKRVCLALLVEIYKNNISDLLKLRNDDKLFFAAVLKQVQAEIDAKQYSVLVNYIEFFAVATQFNAAILEENAKDIFNCLFDENVQDSNTVSHLINKEVPDEIREYTTILKQAQKLDISKTQSGVIFTDEQQDIDEMDERSNIFSVIELSDRMLFVSNLLALIGAFGRNCSADFKNKIQKKLSMNTLIELAASAKFNYYLKTTLVDVLANIYITTKIDQNSKSFVLDLISSIFTADLKEYFKSQSSSLTSKDIFFINKTPKVDCLVLQNSKRGPAWNLTVFKVDPLMWKYIYQHLSRFIYKFVSICANENNHNILESLYSGILEVIQLKDTLVLLYKTQMEERTNTYNEFGQRQIELSASISKKSLYLELLDRSPFMNSPMGFTPEKKKFATPKKSPKRQTKVPERANFETMETQAAEFDSLEDFMHHFKMKLEEIVKYFEDLERRAKVFSQNDQSYYRLFSNNNKINFKDFRKEKITKSAYFHKLTEAALVSIHPSSKEIRDKSVKSRKRNKKGSETPLHLFFKQSSIMMPPSQNISPREKYLDNNNLSPTRRAILLQEAHKEINVKNRPEFVSPVASQKDMSKPTHLPKNERLDSSPENPEKTHILKHKNDDDMQNTLNSFRRINLISEKYLIVGPKKIAIDQESAQQYLDFELFRKFLISLVDVLQDSSLQIKEACEILDYFSYCLENSLTKKIVVDIMEETSGVKPIIGLMNMANGNTEYMTSVVSILNKLLQVEPKFQKECSQIIYNDVDNKLLNIYFGTLDLVFDKFFEVEEIDVQFIALKHQEEEKTQSIDTPEEVKISTERFELQLTEISGSLMKSLCELLGLGQQLCLHHNQGMQNFFRLQTYKHQIRPMQVNAFEKLRNILKSYTKIMRYKNLLVLVSLFNLLATLVEGPCKENQREVVSKKILAVMDEAYNKLFQMIDPRSQELKSKSMLMYLRLKLGIVEATSDSYIIKTVGLSISSDFLFSRIEQIYCKLFGLKSFSAGKGKQVLGNSDIEDEILDNLDVFARKNKTIQSRRFKEDSSKQYPEISSKLYNGRDYSTMIKEGLFIMIWINQICELDKNIIKNIKVTKEEMEIAMKYLKPAIKFFQEKIKSVEIINNSGDLQTIYFYTHPITRFLSSHTKSAFEYQIDRRSWNTKLMELTNGVDALHTEMRHFEKINQWVGIHVNLSYLKNIKIAAFVIALIVNLFITFSRDLTQEKEGDPIFRPWNQESNVEQFVFAAGWALFVLYSVILVLWLLFEYSVKKELFYVDNFKKYQDKLAEHSLLKDSLPSKRKVLWLKIKMMSSIYWKLLVKTELWSIIFFIICCILGMSTSKFYFSFLLLDIVNISQIVRSVIKSLSLNSYLLGGTALFALILIFIYTSFTYYYADVLVTDLGVTDQPHVQFCESFLMCYLNMVSFGLRMGGGVGDMLQLPPSHDDNAFVFRQLFDLVFFLTVILLLMNIVLGIIVDSFAEIRDLREKIGKI